MSFLTMVLIVLRPSGSCQRGSRAIIKCHKGSQIVQEVDYQIEEVLEENYMRYHVESELEAANIDATRFQSPKIT